MDAVRDAAGEKRSLPHKQAQGQKRRGHHQAVRLLFAWMTAALDGVCRDMRIGQLAVALVDRHSLFNPLFQPYAVHERASAVGGGHDIWWEGNAES